MKNYPFYASQLEQIRESMIENGVKSSVADSVVESLAAENGILAGEEYPFEESEENSEETTLG